MAKAIDPEEVGEKRRARARESRNLGTLPESAFLLITLNRATGEITLDDEFSTPAETWAMMAFGADKAQTAISQANGLEAGEL